MWFLFLITSSDDDCYDDVNNSNINKCENCDIISIIYRYAK